MNTIIEEESRQSRGSAIVMTTNIRAMVLATASIMVMCMSAVDAFQMTRPITASNIFHHRTTTLALTRKPLSPQHLPRNSTLESTSTNNRRSSLDVMSTPPLYPKLSGTAVNSASREDAFEASGSAMVDGDKEVYERAVVRTLQWIAAAAIFGFGIWSTLGAKTAEEFFAGYLVEQSLSVDNLFVFLLLFDYFKVPIQSQDRVLTWGIFGAVVMRAIMIWLGAAALENFRPILLVFAAILVYSSAKVLIPVGHNDDEGTEVDIQDNNIVKFSRSLIDSVDEFDGDRFFTIVDGVKKATPLFICLIAVEISDVVFAVDSIPAVFGVTQNPFIVFTSNIFAIMGLRSLYTLLSKAASDLTFLEPAVALVLGFIGSKMIAEYFGYHVPTEIALAVVATLLSGGIGLSVLEKERENAKALDDANVSESDLE